MATARPAQYGSFVRSRVLRRAAALGVALVVGAASHARGQSVLQEWHGLPGVTGGNMFGNCFDLLPDVDGDGVLDLVVGSPYEQPVKRSHYDGAVYVLSGATAAVIRVHYGSPHAQLGTDVAALDDVDGDGVADYAAIDGILSLQDYVTVWSGATGAVVWQVYANPAIYEHFWGMVSVLHDFDGDGLRDLGVSASRSGSSPGTSLTILSSASGVPIVHWLGNGLGRVMAACSLDDRTGDAVPEFAVGHDHSEGKVEIVDGATLVTIATLLGERYYGQTFGDHVGQIGDADGDGVRDLVVADQDYAQSYFAAGRVYVYSGATFALLHQFESPYKNQPWGYGVVSERSDFDFNGDGFSDLAIGGMGPASSHWQYPPTGIYVYSGRNGRLLHFIPPGPYVVDQGLGSALHFVDWNGDGFDDIVGGAIWNNNQPKTTGAVQVFAGNDLFLQMDQPAWYGYTAGDSIEATTRGGEPNEWTLLALVDVDGTPTFDALSVVQLDAFGESLLTDTVPSGLAGTTITVRAYATHPTRRKLAVSDDVVVQFQ